MFIGHFALGLAAKRAVPSIHLGTLFIACQFLDLLRPIFVLLGVESVAVDHSATVVTALDFSYYPYSHSLLMALLYFLITFLAFAYSKSSVRIGLIVSTLVFSHWVLDLISHRPDLPIFFEGAKVGLSLWNSLPATLVVELALFAGGIGLYLSLGQLSRKAAQVKFWSLILFLLLIYAANVLGAKPPVDTPSHLIAGPALAMWIIIIWAYWIEKAAESD